MEKTVVYALRESRILMNVPSPTQGRSLVAGPQPRAQLGHAQHPGVVGTLLSAPTVAAGRHTGATACHRPGL